MKRLHRQPLEASATLAAVVLAHQLLQDTFTDKVKGNPAGDTTNHPAKDDTQCTADEWPGKTYMTANGTTHRGIAQDVLDGID